VFNLSFIDHFAARNLKKPTCRSEIEEMTSVTAHLEVGLVMVVLVEVLALAVETGISKNHNLGRSCENHAGK